MSNIFLDKLYAEKCTGRALDLIFDMVDDLLDGHSFQSMDAFMVKHGSLPVFYHSCDSPNFEALDNVLREVDLSQINSTVALGFLSAPFSARKHLKGWNSYLDRFRRYLIKTHSRKKAKDLLDHFYQQKLPV